MYKCGVQKKHLQGKERKRYGIYGRFQREAV